ncbi:ABC transporter substrate-binding protein [Paenibacillus humicola]|uniref:ABC transporter substrate-binding protein n=1 Tax=Paenibacillus humicola TaxID=3110540 RepID=UPI00237BFAB1|nr:ABC transporter substrate-binding protein [Paenibacillus humicola]
MKRLLNSGFIAMLAVMLLLAGCSGGAKTNTPAGDSSTPPSSSSGSETTPPAAAGGTLNISLYLYPTKLDPKYSVSIAEKNLYQSLYDKLLDIDKDGNLIPMLAEKWEISDDKKTYTFHLRKGVKFHDGTDFNADAVKFNFDRYMEDDSAQKNALKSVDTVTVVDPYTVKVQLKQPFAPFLSLMIEKAGMMVSPAAVKKYGADFNNHPVGTGPFMFKEAVAGSSVTLEKNPNYWQAGLPKMDQVVFKTIQDTNVAFVNLKSGDVDITDKFPYKEIDSVKNDPKVTLINEPSLAFEAIYLNTAKPPFNDKALRQAVDLLIDRDAIVKVALNGAGVPGHSPFAPNVFAHGDSDIAAKPDLAKAKQLLNGKTYTFTLKVGTLPSDQQTGQMIQTMLKPAGIDVKLEKVEVAALDEQTKSKNFDAVLAYWSGRQDPDQSIYDWLYSTGTMNYSGYSNPEVDKLLDEARAETDNAKRKATYDQVMAIVQQDVPNVYLYHVNNTIGVSKAVQGFTYIPDGMIRTANISK